MMPMASALYRGWVRHRRFLPKDHQFRYPVFMLYLDLAELDTVFSQSPFWSDKPWAIARFKRADFHGDPAVPLREAVLTTVLQRTGQKPDGPVRMLANLRYFGVNMNPLCTYYCFDRCGRLNSIVAEVNNTPWNQKHAYVLRCDEDKNKHYFEFAKVFHVSPFNPLDMTYRWFSNAPGQRLSIQLENWQAENKIMDATVILQRLPINRHNLHKMLIQYPVMTVKVMLSIYIQAVRLWLKRLPVFTHPNNTPELNAEYSKKREKM